MCDFQFDRRLVYVHSTGMLLKTLRASLENLKLCRLEHTFVDRELTNCSCLSFSPS